MQPQSLADTLHRASPLPRRAFLPLAKVAVSLALLGVLAITEPLTDLWESASHANPALIIAALALLSVQFPLAAWRWGMALEPLAGTSRERGLLRLVWIGQLTNQVLPTFLAGDGFRLWQVTKSGVIPQKAFSSLFWDRAFGFAGIAVLIVITAPHLADAASGAAISRSAPALALAALVIMAATILAGQRTWRFNAPGLIKPWLALIADGWAIAARPYRLAAILGLAVVTNVIASLAVCLIAESMDLQLSITDAITLIPIALFASLLPISVAGWGVREWTLVYLLSLLNVARADALALSLMFGGASLLVSLPGALFFLKLPSRVRSSGDGAQHPS